jgi:Skp family chaperone for outer membrane proteins
MPEYRSLVRAIGVCALVVALVAPVSAQTAGPIGVVDLARLQANYTELHDRERVLGQWLQAQRAFHDEAAHYIFLSERDFSEVLNLLGKPRPLSAEDEARLQELREVSNANDQRYLNLRAMTERDATQAAEFNQLQEMYEARATTLQEMQQSIMEELGERRETALSGLMTLVDEAIEAVAAEGGYQAVIDSDAMLYGGVDITDTVLERLNEMAAPAVTPPAADDAANEDGAEGGGQQDGEGG